MNRVQSLAPKPCSSEQPDKEAPPGLCKRDRAVRALLRDGDKLFGMRIKKAAKSLGVGLSTMRTAANMLGIRNWPDPNGPHKKLYKK
jgi:hypothetical protein